MKEDVLLHAYVMAMALVVGVAFGPVWSLVPLTFGFILVLTGMIADVLIAREVRRVRTARL